MNPSYIPLPLTLFYIDCYRLTIYIYNVTINIVNRGGNDNGYLHCKLFGHRHIEQGALVEERLESLLYDLITGKEYVEFLIGRDGEFDLLAASVVKRAIRKYSCGNARLVLVLPYMRAEFRDNEKSYLDYYDEVEICEEAAKAHYKSAIQVRNRSMVDRSDLVVCCIRHKSGGAYKTVQYALREGKVVVNVP